VAAAAALGLVVNQYFLSKYIDLRTFDLLRGCLPSAFLCLGSVLPVLLWSLVAGVGLDNFVTFGIAGGLMTVAAWFVSLHLLRHPLLEELAPIKQWVASLLRRP